MKHKTLVMALGAALSISFAASAFAAAPDANRVLVKFKPGTRANAENAIKAAGGKFHLELANLRTFAVTLSPRAAEALRNNPNIELIEVDQPRYPMAQVSPYGIAKVQAPETIAVGADGTGIKVCIIDSGIKSDHEDFAGVAMTGQSGQNWGDDTAVTAPTWPAPSMPPTTASAWSACRRAKPRCTSSRCSTVRLAAGATPPR
jgi:subtilisin family serine protease